MLSSNVLGLRLRMCFGSLFDCLKLCFFEPLSFGSQYVIRAKREYRDFCVALPRYCFTSHVLLRWYIVLAVIWSLELSWNS